MSSILSVQDRDHLINHPTVKAALASRFKRLLSDVRAKGYPLLVWEVYRSEQHQQELYCQGRSSVYLRKMGVPANLIAQARLMGYNPDKPRITKRRLAGMHSQGRAMDCVWLIKGQPSWNAPDEWWQCYGDVAKRLGLTWGGDWKMRDMAHVQWEKKL